MNKTQGKIYLLLDNIRSVHNVGSIFRTAEAAGISRIYCVGTTPMPLDRFGRKRKDFAKVSLGAEDMVAWQYLPSGEDLLRELKKDGFTVVAVEQADGSVDYRKVKVGNKTIIILGNEVDGVSTKLLRLADVVAEIPLSGKKESLNVSVAAGVAIFRMIDHA